MKLTVGRYVCEVDEYNNFISYCEVALVSLLTNNLLILFVIRTVRQSRRDFK